MSRTNKKAYTKSKRFDKTCRNHGSCSWCYGNRMHKVLKKLYPIEPEVQKYYDMEGWDDGDHIEELLDSHGLIKRDPDEIERNRVKAYKYLIP